MKINRLKCIAMGLLSLMVSCGQQGSERQLKENVDSFATHYFNWQFEQAIPYCTPTSKVWLQFAASNVHSEDIDVLRNRDEGASIELGEIHDTDNDSIAYIDLIVRNYVASPSSTKMSNGKSISKACHGGRSTKKAIPRRSESRNPD